VDVVHRFQAGQVCLGFDPARPDPGDVVIGEDDLAAQAAGLERVLEVRPGANPGPGDAVGVGAHVFHQPLLAQDLGAQHGLRVAVVVAEADAHHGDHEAVGDGRDDRHAVRLLEALGPGDTLFPGGQFLHRHGNLDHFGHQSLHSVGRQALPRCLDKATMGRNDWRDAAQRRRCSRCGKRVDQRH